MKLLFKFLLIIIIFLLIILGNPSENAFASVSIENWVFTSALPASLASNQAFVFDNKLLTIGGANDYTLQMDVVAQITPDGTTSLWEELTTTPQRRFGQAGVLHNRTVYVIGGRDPYSRALSSVDRGTIETEEDTLDWSPTTPLPLPLANGTAVNINSKIYHAGGDTGTAYLASQSIKEVYVASIEPNTGNLSDWTLAGYLPEKMLGFGMMEINGYLYIFGGRRDTSESSYGISSKVQRAIINPDGTIGDGTPNTWELMESFPKPIWRSGMTRVGNVIVSAGGHNYLTSQGFLKDVYYSTINDDGTISAWQEGPQLPYTNCCAPLVSWNDYMYFLGGMGMGGDGYHKSNVYTDHVIMSQIPGATQTPPPEPTPEPVKKVVFAPGFGGSWNADAILNCQPDPDPSNWTLAPYAEDIYSPILTALFESGWDVMPFYYDWRAEIPQNGQQLGNIIDDMEENKVNFVGHSMGGIVGRAYLENNQGGKIENYLSVGSPHRGVVQTYPAWAGGELWDDNFLAKIAATIYLKHCGGILSTNKDIIHDQIPSVQNLLPTFEYLKEIKSGNMVEPTFTVNNFLSNSFNFWGVRVGTLTGSGYSTLESVQIKAPSKKDIVDGDWQDGKPAGKMYSVAGDGTVLSKSSEVDGAENITINQTHSGLVSSAEGMAEILKFLGPSAPTALTDSAEPESALVIIGYPGDFTLTSDDGETKKDKDGMVAIMNPESKNYHLKLFPKSNKTLLIVLKMTPSGKINYKEYSLAGMGPKFQTIDFNSQRSDEEITN